MTQAPNSIGQFVIGESQIGDLPFDWTQTVLSQYANSPVMLAILANKSAWYDPTGQISLFYDQCWNLETAQGYGLDVWGRIVGVERVLPVSVKYLGFEEAGQISADPFNQSPFYSGLISTSNYALSDDAFRQLIYAKAAANIWDGSIPGLNGILRTLFPGEVAYVEDGQDMTMTYYFGFALTPVQLSIVLTSGVLPHPAGVGVSYVQL